MEDAARRQDMAALIALSMQGAQKPSQDYIDKTIGCFLNMYYLYVESFKGREPIDIDDICDGLLYLEVKNKLLEQQRAKDAQSRKGKRGK